MMVHHYRSSFSDKVDERNEKILLCAWLNPGDDFLILALISENTPYNLPSLYMHCLLHIVCVSSNAMLAAALER